MLTETEHDTLVAILREVDESLTSMDLETSERWVLHNAIWNLLLYSTVFMHPSVEDKY